MPPAEVPDGSADTARILLIEDDPRSALLIGEMLRTVWGEGLVLSHAERLDDATQELLERGATVVLLDLSPRRALRGRSGAHRGSQRALGRARGSRR